MDQANTRLHQKELFGGDLRTISGNTEKEKTLSDSVDRNSVLINANNFMPDTVSRIEQLLSEYDNWGKLYEQKQQEKDWDFEPTPNFIEMSTRICDALEKIKAEIN